MKVLFLGIGYYSSIKKRGIYLDLLREFIANGHEVFVVSSMDPKRKEPYLLFEEPGAHILCVQTGKIKRTNALQKGINTVLIEKKYIKAIEKHYEGVVFDLILYPTPPITFLNVVEYIKKRDGARTYLMLKDIFPQNAVDIGMMSKKGIKGIAYRYFRKKEKRLYAVSDCIGCMSQANIDYVLKHNPEIKKEKVEICPNCTEIIDMSVDKETANSIRQKYGIPLDKKVFVYGGNLGKPQGIPFLIECLNAVKDIQEAFFLIIGSGTEFKKLEEYEKTTNQPNFKLMARIPRDDYDVMIGACDVGMIFLDYRFTIPNFPSRLLGYMQGRLPVLACTDISSDVGKVIVDGDFGWWCESRDSKDFASKIQEILEDDIEKRGDNAFDYLAEHYDSKKGYNTIIKWCDI